MVIVSLGALRPSTWTQFFIGTICALVVAAALAWWIPRLYPWTHPTKIQPNAQVPEGYALSKPEPRSPLRR